MPDELILAINQALNGSTLDVAVPDFNELSKQMATGLGLKSASFLDKKNVRYCMLKLEEPNNLTLVPTRHTGGTRNGHEPKQGSDIKVLLDAPIEEIAHAVELAFSQCE